MCLDSLWLEIHGRTCVYIGCVVRCAVVSFRTSNGLQQKFSLRKYTHGTHTVVFRQSGSTIQVHGDYVSTIRNSFWYFSMRIECIWSSPYRPSSMLNMWTEIQQFPLALSPHQRRRSPPPLSLPFPPFLPSSARYTLLSTNWHSVSLSAAPSRLLPFAAVRCRSIIMNVFDGLNRTHEHALSHTYFPSMLWDNPPVKHYAWTIGADKAENTHHMETTYWSHFTQFSAESLSATACRPHTLSISVCVCVQSRCGGAASTEDTHSICCTIDRKAMMRINLTWMTGHEWIIIIRQLEHSLRVSIVFEFMCHARVAIDVAMLILSTTMLPAIEYISNDGRIVYNFAGIKYDTTEERTGWTVHGDTIDFHYIFILFFLHVFFFFFGIILVVVVFLLCFHSIVSHVCVCVAPNQFDLPATTQTMANLNFIRCRRQCASFNY